MRQKTTGNGSKKAQAGGVATREAVAVDYPQEGETIVGAHYTFRIGAAQDARLVEACVDQGPWQPCRQDVGYWWYDWSGFAPGRHQVRARMTDPDGNVKMTMLRWFQATPAA